MKTIQFTRQDYLNNRCTHAEYYDQFVTDYHVQHVGKSVGVAKIKNSTNEHFNDIPLATWDMIRLAPGIVETMKSAGDGLTLAEQVCINKAAARRIKNDLK